MPDRTPRTLADQYFRRNQSFRIAICRHCRHAVKPQEIIQHLSNRKGPHRLSAGIAQQVFQMIDDQWGEVFDDINMLPTHVQHPIKGLEIYDDGLLCTRGQCAYVCRTTKTMQLHWQTKHQFSVWTQRRRPQGSEIEARQQAIDASLRRIVCQRMFPRGFGSHYIHVRKPGPDYEPAPPPPRSDVVHAATQHLEQLYQDAQTGPTMVQAGPLDEANSWLRRTEWPRYLKGAFPNQIPIWIARLNHFVDINTGKLLECVQAPKEDAQGPEGAARAIWEAMEGVARISQRITKQTGQMIRAEAARLEKDEIPHKPLLAYMDEEQIQRHVEPWQQILMFFARTQVAHDWRSPRYCFKKRQWQAWQALWRLAQDTRGSPDPIQPEPEPELPEAPDPAPTEQPQSPDSREDQYQMTPIQEACMDFCIELLNQSVNVDEYECALVCALAVLGQGRDHWLDAESYPPILSKMIKIGRFMVLHKALRMDPHADQIVDYIRGREQHQVWFSIESPMEDPGYTFRGQDEGYASDSRHRTPEPSSTRSSPAFETMFSSQPAPVQFTQEQRAKPRRFREWLRLLTDRFMVRGTHSPMQWMLDLRTYGLRIHYSATAAGHVTWQGEDELLYKEAHFTMGDFRGFIHGLVSSMREHLHGQLLMCDADTAPAIPWDQIKG